MSGNVYRYRETGKRGNDRSRNDVVDVMRELSQQHTMARPFGVLDEEIDLALDRRFARPEHPRPGPAKFRALGFDHNASDHAERFVAFEETLAAAIAGQELTGDAIDQAVRGADLGDIRPAVVAAMERIGLSFEQFVADSTVVELMRFMDDLPTRYVTNVLRSARHRQAQQKWEPNDFIDIVALPVAAVHCDVVVTEKQWVHRMRHGKVDERYDTVLLSDAADLVEVLTDPSVG